jgi:hypothetical protein
MTTRGASNPEIPSQINCVNPRGIPVTPGPSSGYTEVESTARKARCPGLVIGNLAQAAGRSARFGRLEQGVKLL